MSTTQLHAERAHKCCWRPSERITECTWSCLGVSFRVLQTKEPFFTKLSSLTHTYACNTFVLNMLGRRDMQACHTYTPDIDRDSHTRGFAGPAAHQRAHLDAYDQRLPGGITQRAMARPRQPAHGRPVQASLQALPQPAAPCPPCTCTAAAAADLRPRCERGKLLKVKGSILCVWGGAAAARSIIRVVRQLQNYGKIRAKIWRRAVENGVARVRWQGLACRADLPFD
jgi:hypothetical protein